MRDNLKDEEYFNNFIKEDLARIKKFSDKLKNGDVKAERVRSVKAKVHDLNLGIVIARYSKGEDISLLEDAYLKLVDTWEDVWEPEYYNKNLKMISLAVLFHVNEKIVKNMKGMLKKSDINDWLLEFLLDSLDEETVGKSSQLLFPDAFSTLQEIVFAENKVELLKRYLCKEWYNKDCGCYEAHKSKQNIYYGYWSFEAGAIAKILNVDDSSIRHTLYYPYDLVHYKK